ncbi:MAG: hypothetical protein IKU63_03090 [Bacteroidaceae bacterium]|nr:hypothetical protein [Bacteroidaceae bacterium]
MKENAMIIKQLCYRIQRYKAMGNGAMCQSLQCRVNRLQQAMSAVR